MVRLLDVNEPGKVCGTVSYLHPVGEIDMSVVAVDALDGVGGAC